MNFGLELRSASRQTLPRSGWDTPDSPDYDGFNLGVPRLAHSPSQMSFHSDAGSDIALSSGMAFKCDIMLKFLRQRQQEKLWARSGDDEGVVLKRAKNDFVCEPSELLMIDDGLYGQIRRLNVKVRLFRWRRPSFADDRADSNDDKDGCHPDVPRDITTTIRPVYWRSTHPSALGHFSPFNLQETSLCSIHQTPRFTSRVAR